MIQHPFRLALLIGLFTLIPLAVGSQQSGGIRGFTTEHLARERDLERKVQGVPSPGNLREYMRTIAAEPHHAGSSGSRKVAEYVLGQFKSWGLNASIEQFEALMPYPTERIVELVEPERHVAALKEPVVVDDPDSGDVGQLPTFNAYSADGDVTADLVYVNYGTPEDYEQLPSSASTSRAVSPSPSTDAAGEASSRKWRPSMARQAASSTRIRETMASTRETCTVRAPGGPRRACNAAVSWICLSIQAIR